MNRNTKKVVYEILEKDKYARENDLYLIFEVLNRMIGIDKKTAITTVLNGMKFHGVSFESITRHRRKWLELHPDIKEKLKITEIREKEEEEYILENMNHIPNIF